MIFYVSMYLSIYVSMNLCTYAIICLSTYLSDYLTMYLPFYRSISFYLSTYLFSICLSIFLSAWAQLCESSFKSGSWPVQNEEFCEMSSRIEGLKLQNKESLRDLALSKVKQFCETQTSFKRGKCRADGLVPMWLAILVSRFHLSRVPRLPRNKWCQVIRSECCTCRAKSS